MKSIIKKSLSLVLALGLVLTVLGCSVAYADSRREFPATPVTVERPDKQEASTPAAPAKPDAPTASPSVSPAPAVPTAPAADAITAEQAKALALQALGLSDAHFTDVERDDGKYEVTLCDGSTEYDVDIGVRSGSVLEIDRDRDGCDRCEWDDDDWDDRYDDDWDDRYDDWDDRWDD